MARGLHRGTQFAAKLGGFLKAGKPVLLTDGLAKQLSNRIDLAAARVSVLPVQGEPKSLLDLPQDRLDALREPLLAPFRARFQAPARVGLYLFNDGSTVVENFTDAPVSVKLNGQPLTVEARGWKTEWNGDPAGALSAGAESAGDPRGGSGGIRAGAGRSG